MSNPSKNKKNEKPKSKDDLRREAMGITNPDAYLNGGQRPGAGRKKGGYNRLTADIKIAEKYYKERVVKSINKITIAQMNLASGCQFLMKIEKEFDKTTKCWKTKKNARPVIVKDKEEIMTI